MASDNRGVIYGTAIDTQEVLINLERFIREFDVMVEIQAGTQKEKVPKRIYMDELRSLLFEEEKSILNVVGSHIKQFDREMYYQFIYFPAEMISCFDLTLKNMFSKLYSDFEQDPIKLERYAERRETLMVGI